MKFDLEDRLVRYSCSIVEAMKYLPNDTTGRHLRDQLIRSSISSALNYGEALSAESRKDFVHKIKILLKELRESRVGLKILKELKIGHQDYLNSILSENSELIAIFQTSVKTARKNLNNTRSR